MLAILQGIFAVAYPVAVYVGVVRFSARAVGALLLLLLLPSMLLRLWSVPRRRAWDVLKLPLTIACLVALSAALDDHRFMLALPVLINLALLVGFGRSLRTTPMVERFARLRESSLSEAQVRYCRSVTLVWCAFFAINGAVCAALACFAPLATWAIYTSGVAYALIGLLGTAEYIVRKARFRKYGNGLHDRLLAQLFPPRKEAS